jgi:hypothetical protein
MTESGSVAVRSTCREMDMRFWLEQAETELHNLA